MRNRLFHKYREDVIPKTLTEMFLIVNSEANKITDVIIQQIVTLSKYGHDALDICHP